MDGREHSHEVGCYRLRSSLYLLLGWLLNAHAQTRQRQPDNATLFTRPRFLPNRCQVSADGAERCTDPAESAAQTPSDSLAALLRDECAQTDMR